jgi:CspA family cold shock protein
MQGTVKWFNDAKGYGFISQETGEDVFVHYTAIREEGFRTLAEGEKVEFEVQQGPKGLQAVTVSKLLVPEGHQPDRNLPARHQPEGQ